MFLHHQSCEFELLSVEGNKTCLHIVFSSYSRKVHWVVVGRTNRDPKVVAAHFLDFLKEEKVAPRVIRMDKGTENGTIANIQIAIRSFDVDRMAGANSVILGPSTANQVRHFNVIYVV